MMKMHGKWVAWMAALALAAMLAATPREGAAGPRPYLMPQDPPGPILGEPDVPGGGRPQLATNTLWLRVRGFSIGVRFGQVPMIMIVGTSIRAPQCSRKRVQ